MLDKDSEYFILHLDFKRIIKIVRSTSKNNIKLQKSTLVTT